MGRGASQQRTTPYSQPNKTGSSVRRIGEGYHLAYQSAQRIYLAEADADHWTTFVHQRLTTPTGQPGALTLFQAAPTDHPSLAKHLTVERQTEEFVAGKGLVTRWERVRRNNHWLDALYNACAAGHFAGVRLFEGRKRRVAVSQSKPAQTNLKPTVRLQLSDWTPGNETWPL